MLTPAESRRLAKQGMEVGLTRVQGGKTVREFAAAQAVGGYTVWRSWDEPGGIRDQMYAAAANNPSVAKLVKLGTTYQGREILAVKLTKGAPGIADGSRPAVLYSATQHAREWISTEVTRRLMEYFASNDKQAKRLRRKRQLWFVPVVNPDGYQYTFDTERLWRKNLRDNNGDGQITGGDGVDLNRNYPERWGYDDEGSASDTADETYRGPSPGSEPETKADMKLIKKIDPVMAVSYHSYGPLLLYPQGWQIQTPTADDPIYIALSGTDDKPAIKGFDPDVAAELYTTNGEFTDWAHQRKDALAWTPELDEGCEGCGFVFPDDEKKVKREYKKNVGFAVDLARSAADPAQPKSRVGKKTEPFYLKTTQLDPERANNPLSDLTFKVSYGDPQPVEILARRSVKDVEVRFQINGGRKVNAPANPWKGGETYDAYDIYYRYFRGQVTGTKPGDKVKVWFTGTEKQTTKKGKKKRKQVKSKSFTYTAKSESHADALILSAEDYTGASPDQSGGPSYLGYYEDALERCRHQLRRLRRGRRRPPGAGRARRAQPLRSGALVHRRRRDHPRAGRPAGHGVTPRQRRDARGRAYMNDGGKLLYTGQYAGLQYTGNVGDQLYDPKGEIACNPLPAGVDERRCLLLRGSGDGTNDVLQYYFGGYLAVLGDGIDAKGKAFDLTGIDTPFQGLDWS